MSDWEAPVPSAFVNFGPSPTRVAELPVYWTTLADEMERMGATANAQTIRQLRDQLHAVVFAEQIELLAYSAAAEEVGVSQSTVARMVREEGLKNHGTPRKPRVRRSELHAHRRAGQSSTTDVQHTTLARVRASIQTTGISK